MVCCILLDISSVFCKNIIFRILAIIFVRFGFFEVFQAFFLHVLRYPIETWYIHAAGGVTRQVRVYSNRDTLTYFTAKNRSKSFISIHGLKNHIEASDLVHTLILWVSWSLLIFVMVGQFLALWRTKTLERGVLLELPASEKFSRLFLYMLWDISLKLGIYI